MGEVDAERRKVEEQEEGGKAKRIGEGEREYLAKSVVEIFSPAF